MEAVTDGSDDHNLGSQRCDLGGKVIKEASLEVVAVADGGGLGDAEDYVLVDTDMNSLSFHCGRSLLGGGRGHCGGRGLLVIRYHVN